MGQSSSQFTEQELQDYQVLCLWDIRLHMSYENIDITLVFFQDLTYFTKKEILL